MRVKTILISFIYVVTIGVLIFWGLKSTPYKYGQKAEYVKNKSMVFPDFTVTFKGERDERHYYDFEIASGQEKKIVSWSSFDTSAAHEAGGENVSVQFGFESKDYVLQKGPLDYYISGIFFSKFGSTSITLQENEFVIWEYKKYQDKTSGLVNL